jgi:uncharacterized membrane protein YphA (DoxX/SURF4 family)
MRIPVRVIQVIVGVLFIISGLVKANDPLGLAYKMEEFFDLWNLSLSAGHFFAKSPLIGLLKFLDDHNLFLSISMITLEIVTGVALLLGWMKKFILYLLLVLIVFFTFLTGYAYLSGKFTNCGCFGDCLPITPKTSFTKDIVLLLMIIFLIIGQKFIQPIFSGKMRTIILAAALIFTLALQWYVLKYLPLADCLPMKKGNNLTVETKPPKNSIPSVYETRLVYQNKTNGQLRDMTMDEFNNSKIWEDSNWKWVKTDPKLVKQGTDIPRLQNFVLTTTGGTDSTEAILNDPSYQVFYFVDAKKRNSQLVDTAFLRYAKSRGIQPMIITSSPAAFSGEQNYPVVSCDGTVFRIAARVNPTIYLVKQGLIINKWPLARINSARDFINSIKK